MLEPEPRAKLVVAIMAVAVLVCAVVWDANPVPAACANEATENAARQKMTDISDAIELAKNTSSVEPLKAAEFLTVMESITECCPALLQDVEKCIITYARYCGKNKIDGEDYKIKLAISKPGGCPANWNEYKGTRTHQCRCYREHIVEDKMQLTDTFALRGLVASHCGHVPGKIIRFLSSWCPLSRLVKPLLYTTGVVKPLLYTTGAVIFLGLLYWLALMKQPVPCLGELWKWLMSLLQKCTAARTARRIARLTDMKFVTNNIAVQQQLQLKINDGCRLFGGTNTHLNAAALRGVAESSHHEQFCIVVRELDTAWSKSKLNEVRRKIPSVLAGHVTLSITSRGSLVFSIPTDKLGAFISKHLAIAYTENAHSGNNEFVFFFLDMLEEIKASATLLIRQ